MGQITNDDFDLDIRVAQRESGEPPHAWTSFGTTCWTCSATCCGGCFDPSEDTAGEGTGHPRA